MYLEVVRSAGPRQLASLWDWNEACCGHSGLVAGFSTQLWVFGVEEDMLEELAQLRPEVSIMLITDNSGQRWNLSGDSSGPFPHLYAVADTVAGEHRGSAGSWSH